MPTRDWNDSRKERVPYKTLKPKSLGIIGALINKLKLDSSSTSERNQRVFGLRGEYGRKAET